MNKYKTKWTISRSRLIFGLKVIWKWLIGKPGALYGSGWHLIEGPTGAGKTVLANILIRNMVSKSGFVWANIDEFYNDRVKVFDLKTMFQDGDQKYRLDKTAFFGNDHPERCKGIFIDELNAQFNRRMNKTREYNDTFVPLIAFAVTIRHQLCDRGYFIGQSLLLQDGQITSIIKYRHDIKPSKRWQYYFFRNSGKMIYAPKKLIVTHYFNGGPDQSGNVIWIARKTKQRIKITPQDLETFNTHAFADLFKNLPLYSKQK